MLQKNWLTAEQTAEVIGCTVQHVHYLARKDLIVYQKLRERMFVFDKKSAEKYANTKQTRGRPRIGKKSSN
jgi:hypothetical protein